MGVLIVTINVNSDLQSTLCKIGECFNYNKTSVA